LPTVSIKWLEQRRFVGIDSTDHGIVIASAGTDGKIGAKPSDLLLLALGSCTAYDVVGILEKKRKQLAGLEVLVSAEQDADPPWAFRSFHLHYIVKGKGLTDKIVSEAIELSEEKYCCVAATLRPGSPISYDFEIVNLD
jgi:putative redox protein